MFRLGRSFFFSCEDSRFKKFNGFATTTDVMRFKFLIFVLFRWFRSDLMRECWGIRFELSAGNALHRFGANSYSFYPIELHAIRSKRPIGTKPNLYLEKIFLQDRMSFKFGNFQSSASPWFVYSCILSDYLWRVKEGNQLPIATAVLNSYL